MLQSLTELQSKTLHEAKITMSYSSIRHSELRTLQTDGLVICDLLDRCIIDEIVDDAQSLRLKLETLPVGPGPDAFSVLCQLVSISDKIDNILPVFEDDSM